MLDNSLKNDIFMIVESLGLSVYDIEMTRKKITIYIDKKGGVTINDCETVSKNISALLDVKDPFPSSYTLEVSSPGINRKLKTKDHFSAAIGKKCLIHTHFPIDNRNVFKGVLKTCTDKDIVIGETKIELDNVKKARIDEV